MSQLKLPVSERDHTQGGGADAPITLVEYGDFECPYCGHAYPIVKAAQAVFGHDLRFVFRNFPLTNVHPFAETAAEAAEIAGRSGKFWEMHDLLFENQDNLDEDSLVGYALTLGLSSDDFTTELEKHVLAEKVREDFLSGVKSGVNGTPTFFINAIRYDGTWEHGGLVRALKEHLPS